MEARQDEGIADKVQGTGGAGGGSDGRGGVWLAHTKDEAHRCAHNGISPLL